jgi:hypothetical protein
VFFNGLLDWTASFSCALYFANAEWDRATNASIYVLNPVAFNKASIDDNSEVFLDCDLNSSLGVLNYLHPGIITPDDHVLPSVAVRPVFTNQRMVVQQARNVVCGDRFDPLDKQYPGAIQKLDITPDMADDVTKFLKIVGMDWASYYPDAEGLAKQFKDREVFNKFRIRGIKEDLYGKS